MSSKAIYCALFILACAVSASLAADPPVNAIPCASAQAPADLTIKELEGEWFEVQRKQVNGTFDSGYQCIKIKFNAGNDTTGNVVISKRQEKEKKLEKEESITSPFTFVKTNNTINFMVQNVSLSIKILMKPSAYIISCGFANQDTSNAQAWILSKSRQLKDADKKAVDIAIKGFSDFSSLANIEQTEKKCNGAGSVVPVVSVLALTLFTVLKAF